VNAAAGNFAPLVSGGGPTQLYQGSINAFAGTAATLNDGSSSSIGMYGLVNSTVAGSKLPTTQNMDAYTGITWWQDRRNSNVGYSQSPDNGSVVSCASGCPQGNSGTPNVFATANHVTPYSVGVSGSNGNSKIALNGVWYQPRGAYLDITNGNVGFNCPKANLNGQCPLQLVTGSVMMAAGTSRIVLLGPDDPLITYKAVLIQ
jgi:hypothetical protein